MGHSQWRNFLFIQAIAAHICILRSAASGQSCSQSKRTFKFVFCVTDTHFLISCLSVSVRFKSDQCYGEVQIGDSTFNDDRWDFNNSKVLCRSSECGTALKSQKTPTPKEPDFLCTGNEFFFAECQRKNNKTQSSGNKAVVVCSNAISPPIISLTLPNGTSINSSHAEIFRGSRFSIECTANSIPDKSKSCLLRHNGNSTKIPELECNPSASFNFSVADYNNQGNYSCTYTVDLNGKYESDESAWIRVIVRDPWWKLLIYILPAGALVLLLMVLLVICLVCRRRKRAEKPSDVVLNQVTVRNSYIDDEEEEEEERDYVNMEAAETNIVGTEEMGEQDNDSQDYEDPAQDKSYSRNDEDDYVDPRMSTVAPGDVTKEQSEEEDSSDDEEDYVNLVEQTVDIYGEELDIYENL
ncbi:uncharacterized protein LOC122847246 isoform X1 [Gambusia affinis]|uniref:uncharacterized protein LOC122847246 isoform X1 n=1 Tax=Gambusia affinis TaxID=33528 RepID=UPI001CDC8DE6|nr:uncharacterized protein LOC122847246 isoform X1 [Gambusia affinis]